MPETVVCNLCGSAEAEPRPNLSDFAELWAPLQICRCRRCGLHYLNPRPTPQELIELYLQEPYYAKSNADRGARRLAFYGARMERLEKVVQRRGDMLGVGCLEGGHALEVAQDRGWRVTGVESSEVLASYARENLHIAVQTIHGWDLSGFDSQRYDAVYTHSFEHLSDPRAILAQVRRVLKPDGTVMIEVPYQFHSLKDLIRRLIVRLFPGQRGRLVTTPVPQAFHLYYFDPETLRELLRREGFQVCALRTYVPFHPVYSRNPRGRWLQEALYALGGLVERGPSMEVIARPAA